MDSLKEIVKKAQDCERCYAGEPIYIPMPDPKNSDEKAEVVFINERPGRVGTGQSGYVSFDNDDPSANFFRECFEISGLSRKNIFITNACLCHPLFEGYKDTAPKILEIKNCHFWLEQQLAITKPKLIVTCGRVAFESVLRYFGHWPIAGQKRFLDVVGTLITETSIPIFPVAHTSRLGRVNRSAELQKSDWLKLSELVK